MASGTMIDYLAAQTRMAHNSIELRRTKYFKLSSHIAQLNNAELRSLLDGSQSSDVLSLTQAFPSCGLRLDRR